MNEKEKSMAMNNIKKMKYISTERRHGRKTDDDTDPTTLKEFSWID